MFLIKQPGAFGDLWQSYFRSERCNEFPFLSKYFNLTNFGTQSHPILLGAAITVLSLGIGPFAQQAIKSVPCQLPRSSEIAKLSVIHDLGNKHVSRQGPGIFQIDYATKGAVINGVANPGINVQPLVDCSTGNCTFPPLEGITHSSLGVCTRCMDVASQIVEETDDETGVVIRLPSMIGLSGQSSQSGVGINVGHMPASFDGTDKGESTFNANWEEPYKRAALDYVDIMAYTVAGCVTNGSLKADRINANYNKRTCPNRRVDYESLVSMDMDVVAVQCIYYPCLRNYAAEVHAGVLSEKLVSSVPATPDSDLPGALYVNYTAIKEPCFIHNQAYNRGNFSKVPRADLKFISYNDTGTTQDIPEECLYQMEKPYAMALIAFLTDVFTSNGTMSKNQRQDFGSDNDLIDNIWFQDTWWLSSLWNRNNATVETINSVFESMAAAFTNQVRVSKTANVIEDPQWIYGTVFETNVCTRFEWQWLLFPVFLLSATLVLLLITAGISYMDTHQIPIWKSSLLPLLFYGLEDHNFGSGSGLEEEMKNNNELLGKEALSRASAKKLVRFRRSEIGARFEEVET